MMLEEFKAHLQGLRRSKTTVDKYLRSARVWLGYLQQRGLTLQRCPPSALSDFVTWMGTPPGDVGPATATLYAAGTQVYLRFLRDRVVGVPDFRPPSLPRKPKRMPTTFTEDQLARYLVLTGRTQDPYRTALLILPFCGLRIDELVNLRLGDYTEMAYSDRDHRYLFQLRKRDGWSPKGQKERLVPVFTGPECLISVALHNYIANVRGAFKYDLHLPVAERFMFPAFAANQNQHISRQWLEAWMCESREYIGIPELTPHKCRHHYATALLSVGVNTVFACRYLGHESAKTLEEHYAGIRLDDAERWMGKIHEPTQKDEANRRHINRR
jgi:integrase